jgi:peptidoglycan/LPS O-acetylase OafA/YrhL
MMFPKGSPSIFGNIGFMVLLSLILSILTYFLVERPLRFRKSKNLVFGLLLSMLCIGLFALNCVGGDEGHQLWNN